MMPNIKCPCGNEVFDYKLPSKNAGTIITDFRVEHLIETQNEVDIDIYDVLQNGLPLNECYKCGRLGVESNTTEKVTWFKPESGKYESILGE